MFSDHEADMSPDWQIDDSLAEAILRGDKVDERFAPLVSFARQVEETGVSPVPPPSAALAAFLGEDEAAGVSPSPMAGRPSAELASAVVPVAGPLATAEQARRSSRRRRMPLVETMLAKAAGLGLAAKIGAGATAAVTGVTAAGATGLAPDAVSDPVRSAVSAVTPADLDTSDTRAGGDIEVEAGDGVDASSRGGAGQVGGGADAGVGADGAGVEAGNGAAEVEVDAGRDGVDVDVNGGAADVNVSVDENGVEIDHDVNPPSRDVPLPDLPDGPDPVPGGSPPLPGAGASGSADVRGGLGG